MHRSLLPKCEIGPVFQAATNGGLPTGTVKGDRGPDTPSRTGGSSGKALVRYGGGSGGRGRAREEFQGIAWPDVHEKSAPQDVIILGTRRCHRQGKCAAGGPEGPLTEPRNLRHAQYDLEVHRAGL